MPIPPDDDEDRVSPAGSIADAPRQSPTPRPETPEPPTNFSAEDERKFYERYQKDPSIVRD